MAGKGQELVDLRKAIQDGEKLTDGQVVLLAELQRAANVNKRQIPVSKLALREGEDLWDFAWMMMDAVQTNRIILADGSLDAWLQGIYEDYVIVQDGNTGKMFKADFTRNADGEIEFSEPVEVRMEWVPVAASAESEDEVERAVAKRAPQELDIVDVSKKDESKWTGILPSTLRGR